MYRNAIISFVFFYCLEGFDCALRFQVVHDFEDEFAVFLPFAFIVVVNIETIKNVGKGNGWCHFMSNDFEDAANHIAFY